ncbi:WecB/TagA/CpsF family glycosyltransferase [Thalassococcus sp. CAU 1522]|uniref:WecB/TagA/CpsF family glycosyltransferase n=1 Tax=Thalassococcus arenae TaxID=2851652 RepID=A0ABS6N6C2_9RHOB|nr:WecB/TagA/CpsF family glycosyltransferase [Thalassococcus arenae]MBV2359555.1 WecB/TagA/CpsF family glycosyltransferase [Thalassococcus arenae]
MQFSIADQIIAVNVPSWAALEARVAERLARKRGFALATINLDHIVKLRRSSAFRAAYAQQDLVCADGNPVVWMSRIAGRPVALIPGSDAILPLARIAAKQGVRLGLVGSTEPVLRAAKSYLEREIRDLEVALTVAPPMGFDPEGDEARAIHARLADAGVGLCFVALGAPKQEIFAALGRREAPQIGYASIGAGLDFFAGTQQRAPLWVRRMALEWLWRAASAPRRLGPRYLECLAILPGQLVQAFWLRMRSDRI